MGITFSPNIGATALAAKIEKQLSGDTTEEGDDPPEDIVPDTVEETPAQLRMRLNREARVLKRVRISCMNPNKKSATGDIFTVANRAVGTISRHVPFDVEEGWHVEAMLLQSIDERKFQQFYEVKLPNGVKVQRGRLVREYAIEYLDPLTEEEIAALAQRQIMSGSLVGE